MPKQKPPKPSKAQAQPPTKPQPSPQSLPNWPPLRPLIPSSSLSIDPAPSLPDQIYTIPNFLPSALCKTYVSFLASLPLITTPKKPKKDEAVRVNDRFQIEDARFAEMLWSSTALRELVTERVLEAEEEDYDDDDDDDSNSHSDRQNQKQQKRTRTMQEIWGGEPLGLNSNIRIYRYTKGQFFAQHYDDGNTITFSSQSHPTQTARTTWTLLIYLSSCTGGETVFYPEPTRENRNPEPVSVAPEIGLALLHRHGEQCLLHEGKEVLSGEKWVLRSDLVVTR